METYQDFLEMYLICQDFGEILRNFWETFRDFLETYQDLFIF